MQTIAALAIFALIAVLPQTALTIAGRTRPVASLDPLTATRRYSHALALHLGSREARDVRAPVAVVRRLHERMVAGLTH